MEPAWKQFRWQSGLIYVTCILVVVALGHFEMQFYKQSYRTPWGIFNVIVWGYLLSGPFILQEQIWFSGRSTFLSAGETLWYIYGAIWIVTGLGAMSGYDPIGFLLIFLISHSIFVLIFSVIALIYHLIKMKSIECWWTTCLGCLSVIITSGQCVYVMVTTPFLI